ncbi:MAG: pyrroline-5-carboxylate reductase [Lentisphaeria bacterium]|nr:pyrroline-5-carboxylate reductase [Lentisphaeria bacterium]MBQ8756575.1 pyrroline-5-carboxylate reductase [Lentisphaeria bacterium]
MKILFLGAGKMATAIAGGIVNARLCKADELTAFDVSPAAAKLFSEQTGVVCATSGLPELVRQAEALLIAVKPQTLQEALAPLKGTLQDKCLLSIVAGMPIEKIAALSGAERIIRIMPNTPALVGCGAAGIARGAGAKEEDLQLAMDIFSAVGTACTVPEKNLDAITALSGSGPAYVFEFIQALADGGVAVGLSRDTANALAVQTVIGAAEMVRQTALHPTLLKDQVTSPAGTTIAALEVLEDRAFAGAVIAAVRAAAKRSEELGRK